MLHDARKLEAALSPLLQLPLWKSHRAADLQVFHFGEKRIVTSNFGPRKGEQSEAGECNLLVSVRSTAAGIGAKPAFAMAACPRRSPDALNSRSTSDLDS